MASFGRLDRRTRSKGSNSPLTPTRSSSRVIKQGKRKDAAEVLAIEAYIEDELRRLKYHPETTRRDHYTVHKNAFDQLVEEKAVVYKSVLSSIKAEYEECIAALEKGQSQAIYLQGMVKALMVEKSTMTQFERRGDELEEKIEKLRKINWSLKMKLQAFRDEKERRLASARTKSMRSVDKRVQHTIPGLTVEELTDIPTLRRTLIRLELQASQLAAASETEFVEKGRKSVLKNQIKKKEELLKNVAELNDKLKDRCEVLKVVVEATKKAVDNPDQDIHVTNVVAKALADYGKTKYKRAGSIQLFMGLDDDDPIKKKEAERMIEYCDHFNNLFDFGQFEAAAIHAANSPFGILRNFETLIRFKQADPIEDGQKPLLIFCDALMETACAAQPLTQAMSVECIKCALMEDRLDLATHWLAQGKLSYSIPLGEVLAKHCKCTKKCNCACTLLAQTVFTNVNAHERAAKCISKQEKFITLLHYTKKYGKFQERDYKRLLRTSPSPELAQLMLMTKQHKKGCSILSFPSVASILFETENKDMLIQILKNLSSQKEKELSNLIRRISFDEDDNQMSSDKWLEVVGLCEKEGMYDVGIDILAAITIGEAINRAAIAFSMDYIS